MADRDTFDTLSPEFKVKIDGREVAEELRADLVGVSVLDDVESAGMCSVRLSCWDGVEMKVKWVDDALLNEGKSVVISVGYRDRQEELFSGEISGLEPEFHSSEAPVLTIRSYDRSHRLMKQKKTKSFLRVKDSDIANMIASEANLSPKIDNTTVTFEHVFQHNQTDLEFLHSRAQRIGYEVYVQGTTLNFRKRAIDGSESIVLKREVELLEFYPRSTTMNQVGEVTVRGWDPKQKREIVAKSATPAKGNMGTTDGPAAIKRARWTSRTVEVRSPVWSGDEADALASGLLNEIALQYVTGDGVCIGRPDLRPGRLVKIDGIGRRFGGLYYVTSTEHSYSHNRGYRTAFSVKRSATG